jgi:hypothetical protein
MSYDKNMTGIISKNDRKTDEKHPDIKGQCEINGVQYWVDGWEKTRNSDGGKFYSLSFKRKDAPPQQAPARQAPARSEPAPQGSGFDMEDDIPFRDPMSYRGVQAVL